jgi:hypothetical protein
MKMIPTIVACLIASAAMATSGEVNAKDETRILKAPYPAPDDYTCHLLINKRSVTCDLALYLENGSRRRVQFNNDDSGRMVIFDGKGSPNDTVIVDRVTVGEVEGRPEKVRVTKATGLCISRGYRNADCHAQTVDGQLYEGLVFREKQPSTPGERQ